MDSQPYGRTDTLPPIGVKAGTPEAKILKDLIYQRRLAIIQAFAKPIKLAKKCRKLAAFGEDVDFPDDCKTTVHKIRQVDETQVANHLKEPVQVTIEPNETGEYAKWFWCGPEEVAQEIAMLGAAVGFPLDPLHVGGQMPNGSIQPPLPLALQMVAQFKVLSQQQPDVFDPQFICRLDDEYRAKAAQKMYDSDWREANNGSGGDLWLRSRVHACTTQGWQLPLIERDPQTGNFLLGFNSIEQTYIAQESEIIALAPEAGIDLYLDLDECMSKYPQQAQALVQNQSWITQDGMVPPQGQGSAIVPVQYRDQFRRPMVRKIIWWIRNQSMPVPMSEEEAVNGGHVQPNPQQFIQDDATASIPAETGNQTTNVGPLGGSESAAVDSGIHADQGGPSASVVALDGEDVGIASAGISAPYALSDGTGVDPSHPAWPQRTIFVTRQVTIVSDDVVEDIPLTAWPDIPLLQMRNSLIDGRAWSIGEPFYCTNLQNIITDIATSARDHIDYNAHPAQEMIGTLFDWMGKEYGEAFVSAGKILRTPPTEFKENPNGCVRSILPPPFPDSSLKILDFANEMLNDTAGRPDALSGNTPTPNASGALVANLQQGATEPLNFKAQDIAFTMERLTRFFLHAETHFTPLQKWADLTSIPLPLVALVVDGLKRRPPNVKITVSSGAGATIDKKRNQYVQWNQLIDPADGTPLIDGKTTREALGQDAAAIARRNQEAIRNKATVLAPMQGAAETAAEPAGEQQSGNGNGHGGRLGANNNGNGG